MNVLCVSIRARILAVKNYTKIVLVQNEYVDEFTVSFL